MPVSQQWTVPQRVQEMWKHQASLPALPVPELQQTLMKYLRSAKPLLTQAEFEETTKCVLQFALGSEGGRLQDELIKRAAEKKGSSWLIDWWNHIAYLSDRGPVVFFVSYYFGFKLFPQIDTRIKNGISASGPELQCAAGAVVIKYALEFQEMVESGTLPADLVGKTPQCMATYPLLFNACRIPTFPSDVVATYNGTENRHVVVMRRGRFFVVETHHEGVPLQQSDWERQLGLVIAAADSAGDEPNPIGALTALGRDEWGKARAHLFADSPGNVALLEAIQSAALMINLDHVGGSDEVERSRQYWHGDCRNRFYDKTLQFQVLPSGHVGFLGEHAMADGAPTLRLCRYINSQASKPAKSSEAAISGEVKPPKVLSFVVGELVQQSIQEAQKFFTRIVQDHVTARLTVDGMGRDGIKGLKVGPDAFCQLAMQLAFYRIHSKLAPIYEACSTRRFLHGRTETIRSCTVEGAAFFRTMQDPGASAEDRHSALLEAATQHQKVAADCAGAMGVDRHLLGLRLLVKDQAAMPSIFKDPAYAKTCRWQLSTSNLSVDELESWGFGEVVPEGYGIGYSIQKDRAQFMINCKEDGAFGSRTNRATEFREVLLGVMQDMRAVCVSQLGPNPSRSKL
mmetsp:Transcript_7017/g.11043  ORF Transcript_7017/g.11043 Transcript_7017/m.11043 type:complete len:627 (-) Transcript_7017:96-1976(-)